MSDPTETQLLPEDELLRDAFFSYATLRFAEARQNNTRFVHYTSAENAVRILRSNKVTLRSASLMNDYSEGHYGYLLVDRAVKTGVTGRKMKELLESVHIGLYGMVLAYFERYSQVRPYESFLLSVSEHGSGLIDEDRYGRLSMWRAYGGDTNVALVLNSGPFLRPSDAVKVYTSPVLYADEEIFIQQFHAWLSSVEAKAADLKNVDIAKLAASAAYSLFVSTLSTKHPGFAEEREWRLIYTPMLHPSERLIEDRISISGIPQKVYYLPLKDYPEEGYWGTHVPELLDRLIIGPTAYPLVLGSSFMDELKSAGIENPTERIWASDIPIRR